MIVGQMWGDSFLLLFLHIITGQMWGDAFPHTLFTQSRRPQAKTETHIGLATLLFSISPIIKTNKL